MKALLDTHTFLWWISHSHKLSPRVRKIISNGKNELFISAASGWEIMIKTRLNRIQLPDAPLEFIQEQIRNNFFLTLPIKMNHTLSVYHLPDLHRDPFDRILVAQARTEGLPILTSDSMIAQYPVEVIW